MSILSWLKREWQKFFSSHLLIVITLVLGIAGLFLIGKLKASFLLSIQNQEREILSSDISLSIRRPLEESEISALKNKAKGLILDEYQLIDMSSMVYVPGRDVSRLIELKVINPGFPFYGSLKTESKSLSLTIDHPIFNQDCVLISSELQRLLEIRPEDSLKLGESTFKICDVITSDSTQGFRGFNFAPRVYISMHNLEKTKLLGFGTIAFHAYHLKLKPEALSFTEDWKKDLTRNFKDNALRINTPKDASAQMARSGEILGDYLQLASLVALLLAVVGCFYLFRSLLHRRLKDIAVLRALGASPGQIRPLLLSPLVLDFIVALPLSILFASLAYPLLTQVLGDMFGAQFPEAPFPREWIYQAPMILFVVLCGLLPALEEALRVPVRVLLQDQEKVPVLPWKSYWYYIFGGLASFTALAMIVSHSYKTGGFFTLGILAVTCLLVAVSAFLRWPLNLMLQRVSLHSPFGLSLGLVLRRVIRRPVPTLLTILALGLGGALVSLLAHLEMSLGKEFEIGAQTRPSLFLFDIQDEQKSEIEKFLVEKNKKLLTISPMIRGAISEVNGAPFKRESDENSIQTREQETETRFRQRMMNISWASGFNESEKLISGTTFDDAKTPDGEFAVSLEQRFAGRLKLKLGDQITFEVLGVPILGRVVNLRSVKWTSFMPNFFIVFSPGALEEAPKSWIAAIENLPKDEASKLQNSMALKFPNISAVDVAQTVDRLMELFTKLKQALLLMAWFAFFVGIVVVIAIAQDQILRRQSEVMLEKTLGISPLKVVMMVIGEFILLSSMALTLGGIGGAILSSILTVQVFGGDPVWSFGFVFLQVLVGTGLATLPLLVAAKRIFRLRPAGLLQSP